ncbi:MAG: PepSY-associated TM helix domain-containing protein, partial [Alphaproteobacteria bacterium]
RMHYMLHYLPSTAAYWIVGICTMFMLMAIVTGVIIHKKIFRDFFTFRPARGQRSWLDVHNILSVVALPFHAMITYSGLIFFGYLYMAPVVTATYGPGEENRRVFFDEVFEREHKVERAGVSAPLAPLAPMLSEAERRWGSGGVRFIEIWNPGDANARISIGGFQDTPLRASRRLVFDGASGAYLASEDAFTSTPRAVRDVLLGLHEGLFAGPVLRWLYFLSGLVGTAMIGAGLVLWTTKRRARMQRAGGVQAFGLALVEGLNLGAVVGLPIGIAAYFWANRLIPAAMEGRAAWEAHAMFIAWGLALLWAMARPTARAWVELLSCAAAAYVLLPVLNALTTGRHLGVTLPRGDWRGDWTLAGFDLTMLAFGLLLAWAAWRLHGKKRPAASRPDRGAFRVPAVGETGPAE